MPKTETCLNCHRLIGILETAFIWKGNIVCHECYERLSPPEEAGPNMQVSVETPPSQVLSPAPAQMPERTLWQGNPTHWKYLVLYIFCGLLVLTLIGTLIGIPLLIYVILDRKYTAYTVTNRRVTQKRGIISRESSEISLKDIRNVLVKSGILARLLGFGDIGLATAGGAGVEIKMKGIRDPERVRQLIVEASDRVRELSYSTE